VLKLAALIVAVLAVVAVAAPARFIGVHCFSVRSHPTERSADLLRATANVKGYFRSASSTYLTLPEWYIVYSAEEYASFVKARGPSRFPYFAAIQQYWRYYRLACGATKRVYPFNSGVHLMLGVIGVSFTTEYAIKGAYENTVGRLSEWLGFYQTDEDVFAHKTAREYAEFMHMAPWYEFPFWSKLTGLWMGTPLWGPDPVRKWERRFALSAEYGTKAVYGRIIRWSSGTVYRPEDHVIHAWLDDVPERVFADSRVKRIKTLTARSYIVTLPRYEAFTQTVIALAKHGVRFHDFAGNDAILVTAIAPNAWDGRLATGVRLFSEPILTNPAAKRVAIRAPVPLLHVLLADLAIRGVSIEHVYDY